MKTARKEAPRTEPVTDGDSWFSLAEAARARGISRLSVALEALEGKVRMTKFAGRRYYHRDDIAKLAQEAVEAEG